MPWLSGHPVVVICTPSSWVTGLKRWVSNDRSGRDRIQLLRAKSTVWCNQMGTNFAEISSWTALTRHLGLKTAFYTKYMKSKHIRIFIIKFLTPWNISRKYIFTYNIYIYIYKSTKTQFLLVLYYFIISLLNSKSSV